MKTRALQNLLPPVRYQPGGRLVVDVRKRQPVWPIVSIVFLLCVSVVFAPLLVTILNLLLLAFAVSVFLASRQRIDARLVKLILPFVLTAFLGLASGIGHDVYDYFKDAWYILNPLLVMLIGLTLYRARPQLAAGMGAFVVAGLIISVWHMRGYLIMPDLILLPAAKIRGYIGAGFYAPVLGVIIALVFAKQWREAVGLPRWFLGMATLVMALAVIGSFSRTAWLVITLGVLAAFGLFARREWLHIGVPVLLSAAVLATLHLTLDVRSDHAALQTFGVKLLRSIDEIGADDFRSAREINLNFRAYETQRGMQQFEDSGIVRMLVGQGFGAKVDLGLLVPLQFDEFGNHGVRLIPVLHNGYVYLLTKVGLLGLLLFLYTLGYLYTTARRWASWKSASASRSAARLLQVSVVVLAVTTYIIGGVYNKFDLFPFILLTGYLLGYLWSEEDKQQAAASQDAAVPAAA